MSARRPGCRCRVRSRKRGRENLDAKHTRLTGVKCATKREMEKRRKPQEGYGRDLYLEWDNKSELTPLNLPLV